MSPLHLSEHRPEETLSVRDGDDLVYTPEVEQTLTLLQRARAAVADRARRILEHPRMQPLKSAGEQVWQSVGDPLWQKFGEPAHAWVRKHMHDHPKEVALTMGAGVVPLLGEACMQGGIELTSHATRLALILTCALSSNASNVSLETKERVNRIAMEIASSTTLVHLLYTLGAESNKGGLIFLHLMLYKSLMLVIALCNRKAQKSAQVNETQPPPEQETPNGAGEFLPPMQVPVPVSFGPQDMAQIEALQHLRRLTSAGASTIERSSG